MSYDEPKILSSRLNQFCLKGADPGHNLPKPEKSQIIRRRTIEAAVRPPERVKLGSLLTAIGQDAELSDSDIEALQKSRDKTPAEPMTFE